MYITWIIGAIISLVVIKYMNDLFINKVNRMPLIIAILLSMLFSWISVLIFTFIALVVFLNNNTKVKDFYDKLEKKFNP